MRARVRRASCEKGTYRRWCSTCTAARGRGTSGVRPPRRSGSPTAAILCLEVSFRGSVGYGEAFVNAGDRVWAGRMQDDLLDAVAIAVGAGWAGRAQVAVLRRLPAASTRPCRVRRSVRRVFRAARWTWLARRTLKTLIETETMSAHWGAGSPGDPSPGGRPREGRRLPAVPLPRCPGGRHPDSAAQSPRAPMTCGSNMPSRSRSSPPCARPASTASTCCSPARATGSPKPENRRRFYAVVERLLAHHLGGRAEK